MQRAMNLIYSLFVLSGRHILISVPAAVEPPPRKKIRWFKIVQVCRWIAPHEGMAYRLLYLF
jgi:hypothetical protein